jgi:hypothetical protein
MFSEIVRALHFFQRIQEIATYIVLLYQNTSSRAISKGIMNLRLIVKNLLSGIGVYGENIKELLDRRYSTAA